MKLHEKIKGVKFYTVPTTIGGRMSEYKIHPYCDVCVKDFEAVRDQLKVENGNLNKQVEELEIKNKHLSSVLDQIHYMTKLLGKLEMEVNNGK